MTDSKAIMDWQVCSHVSFSDWRYNKFNALQVHQIPKAHLDCEIIQLQYDCVLPRINSLNTRTGYTV